MKDELDESAPEEIQEVMEDITQRQILQVMVHSLISMLEKKDGDGEHNYMTLQASVGERQYEFTIQRKSGMTPSEKYGGLLRGMKEIAETSKFAEPEDVITKINLLIRKFDV